MSHCLVVGWINLLPPLYGDFRPFTTYHGDSMLSKHKRNDWNRKWKPVRKLENANCKSFKKCEAAPTKTTPFVSSSEGKTKTTAVNVFFLNSSDLVWMGLLHVYMCSRPFHFLFTFDGKSERHFIVGHFTAISIMGRMWCCLCAK